MSKLENTNAVYNMYQQKIEHNLVRKYIYYAFSKFQWSARLG